MSNYLLYLARSEWAYGALFCKLFMYDVIEDCFVLDYGQVIRKSKGLGYGRHESMETMREALLKVGVSRH